MNLSVSPNAQASLLLTAPLSRSQSETAAIELLTAGEYRRLARQLRDLGHVPADLLGTDSIALLRELEVIALSDRLRRLLDRGFLLSQAIERWHSRAIWVLSPADPEYPARIKDRLKEHSPPVLYGCGQPSLLESGGLAVVGSRHADQNLLDYTEAVGQQCALAEMTVISGGAKGIDSAAMRGALEAGGRVTGVLAENLERAVLDRHNRNWIVEEQLVLISPYDPNAGFQIGNAMQRNKLVYALSDAALVVSADHEKGGTWAGATEQLQKFRFVPVYVRSTAEIGPGLQALTKMGARPWPNPQNPEQFMTIFGVRQVARDEEQSQLGFSSTHVDSKANEEGVVASTSELNAALTQSPHTDIDAVPLNSSAQARNGDPAEALIALVREILVDLLVTSKTDSEIASALQVSKTQVRAWLERFVKEGTLERKGKRDGFVAKQASLL